MSHRLILIDSCTVIISGIISIFYPCPKRTFAGVRVADDNRNRLGFRGKPGEEIDAVVLRDGEEVAVTVARGAVQQTSTKAQVLENFSQADADSWDADGFNIIETSVTDEGVVWVLSWSEFTEEASGLTANAYTATRFELMMKEK